MSKILTTIALITGGVLPLFADISVYHLLNPDWDSHARVHEAWRLSTNFCLFSLGMYLLWAKQKEMLPAVLSLCIHFGFFVAVITMPLYGGTSVAEGIRVAHTFGVTINVLLVSSMLIIQLTAIVLIVKDKKTKEI